VQRKATPLITIMADKKCPSPLFSRITLIILGVVAIWLVVSAIVQLIALNQLPGEDVTNLISATKTIAIVQLIVGLVVVAFVLYAIIAPQGTFREYVVPYLEARGEVSEPLPRRRSE
jgi:hypothetical protein